MVATSSVGVPQDVQMNPNVGMASIADIRMKRTL